MKVLLLGAGGMLGTDLQNTLPRHLQLVPLRSLDLDITDANGVRRAVADVRPDLIVNAAAYTAVDRAESEPERAMAVNGAALGGIGQAAREFGATVLHFSTDYVFDGTLDRPYREDDAVRPLSTYGASKLAGEHALLASGASTLIIRTQWLFGLGGRSFPRVMWDRATKGIATRVVNDHRGRPTFSVDLAIATWKLASAETRGIVHVANTGCTTWYAVAARVFHRAQAMPLLEPCAASDYPTAARRPPASILDTSRFEYLTGATLPAWEDALDRFLDLLTHQASV